VPNRLVESIHDELGSRPGVPAFDPEQVGSCNLPVAQSIQRVGLGFFRVHSPGKRVLIEIFKMEGQLADNPLFAQPLHLGKRQVLPDDPFPIRHG
jgi:hypothetical protein